MAPYRREQDTLEPPVPSHPGRPLRPRKGWELAGPVEVKGHGLVGPVPVAIFYPQGPLGPAALPEETLLGALRDLIPARLAEETGGLGRAGLEWVAWLASRLVRGPLVLRLRFPPEYPASGVERQGSSQVLALTPCRTPRPRA